MRSAQTDLVPPLPDAQVTENSIDAVPVFGRSLFQGKFAAESFKGFNPDYLISVGDQIDIKLWGAIDLQLTGNRIQQCRKISNRAGHRTGVVEFPAGFGWGALSGITADPETADRQGQGGTTVPVPREEHRCQT